MLFMLFQKVNNMTNTWWRSLGLARREPLGYPKVGIMCARLLEHLAQNLKSVIPHICSTSFESDRYSHLQNIGSRRDLNMMSSGGQPAGKLGDPDHRLGLEVDSGFAIILSQVPSNPQKTIIR